MNSFVNELQVLTDATEVLQKETATEEPKATETKGTPVLASISGMTDEVVMQTKTSRARPSASTARHTGRRR